MKLEIYVARYFGPTAHRGARVAVRRANCREWEVVEERNLYIEPIEQIVRIAERLSGGTVVTYTTDARSGDDMLVVSHPDAA